MSKGKIVVIEGTDFSGKTTQYEKMIQRLTQEHFLFETDSFPNYESQSSYFVKAYLRGEFGNNAMDIDPKIASTFYTLDRYASYKTKKWGKIYNEGGNILFARYTSSNILHQASKLEAWEEQKEFIDWLHSYEFEMFGLPKDNCTILLEMPPDIAQELKKKRLNEQHGLTSNGSEKDIHEENKEYLARSYRTALKVANYLNWEIISCVDKKGNLKSIEEIHEEIYKIVKNIFEDNYELP